MNKCFLQIVILLNCLYVINACTGELISSGIVGNEKRIILQEHNRLRQSVATGNVEGQPSAENMREMIWDDELAARAQEWANNCQFRHDPKRKINRFTMGQNLAIIWSTAPLAEDDGDFPSRILAWFNEVQKYSFGAPWAPYTGHYSQLVWGDTDLVGCGFAYYKDKKKYNKLYVCNYGPGGNVVGEKPYEVGKPSCKVHGLKPSSKYHGLCSSQENNLNIGPNGILRNFIDNTYEYKPNLLAKNSFLTTSLFFNNNKNQLQQIHQPELQPIVTVQQTTTTTPKPTTTTKKFFFTTTTISPTAKSYNNNLFSTSTSPNSIFQPSSLSGYPLKTVVVHRNIWSNLSSQKFSVPVQSTTIKPDMGTTTVATVRSSGWSLLTWRG